MKHCFANVARPWERLCDVTATIHKICRYRIASGFLKSRTTPAHQIYSNLLLSNLRSSSVYTVYSPFEPST